MSKINIADIKFGRLIEKNRDYEDTYPFKSLIADLHPEQKVQPLSVERILRLPALQSYYNQGDEGACVGYSASWQTSYYNNAPLQKYDARWLYKQAQANDNNPLTDPAKDTGTFVWAAFWVLRHLGHKKLNETKPDINDGLLSYYWGKTADDGRRAISIDRPFVIGINWYESFMQPEKNGSDYWIGKNQLGKLCGGHAIIVRGASDVRQSLYLTSTWGWEYPSIWLSYDMFNKLMKEDGEMCVGVDNLKNT
jgi:hypothetical protein